MLERCDRMAGNEGKVMSLIPRTRATGSRGRMLAFGAAILGVGVVASAFEVTFVQVSDTHYVETQSSNSAASNMLLRINNIAGKNYPDGSGVVGTPMGVIHSGDIINAAGTRTNQWLNFVAHFGLTGQEGILKFPTYEGYGNHDQDSWLTQVSGLIQTRNKTRPYVVNKGTSTPHYSWNWGPVHFVHLNIRCGGSARYNALSSYTFLTNDLAQFVGNTGRPVILIHHLPFSAGETEWPAADQTAYYNAIKDYNVIAILYGHTHAYGVGRWNGIRTVNCEELTTSYLVFRVTDTSFSVYRRLSGSWSGSQTDAITVPPAPRITRVVPAPAGTGIELTGEVNKPYVIQYSVNMLDWTSLLTTNLVSSPALFTDPAGTPAVPRFYRAILGP